MMVWIMIPIIMIDLKYMIIPDALSLPLLWLGIIFSLSGGVVELDISIMGVIFNYLVLWALYWAFRLLLKKEAIGYGDFKLFAALGAFFGINAFGHLLLVAGLCGLILALISMSVKQSSKAPFAPSLCISGMVYMFLFI